MKKCILLALIVLFIAAPLKAAEDVSSVLNWVPPTEYTDNSSLPPEEIALFRIYYTDDGTTPTAASPMLEIPNLSSNNPSAPTTTSYIHNFTLDPSITPYVYSYIVRVVIQDGRESALSEVRSKTFLVSSTANPKRVTGVTVD